MNCDLSWLGEGLADIGTSGLDKARATLSLSVADDPGERDKTYTAFVANRAGGRFSAA